MSIYSKFADRLDAEALKDRSNTRMGTLVLAENAGGDPLLGISYSCDFRSEEEQGAGKMTEIFTRTADPKSFFAKEYLLGEENRGLIKAFKQADLVIESDQFVAFSTQLLAHDSDYEIESALRYIREAESMKDGRFSLRMKYRRLTGAEMKAEAKNRGLKGYSKLSVDELETLLTDDDFSKSDAANQPQETQSQPGWFHFGSLLVFEKKDTLFSEVLQSLVEAARAGHLVVGSGGVMAFGSGFSLFDARDLTDEAKDQISAHNRWYREQMEALKPVAEIVKQGPMKPSYGSAYYFLGRPTLMNGEVKYWLNGASVRFPNGRSAQPFGYYTLQELLDEKYMETARIRSDDDFKTFSGGNYRKEKLTDEQAEAELKSRGLRWASKPMSDATA